MRLNKSLKEALNNAGNAQQSVSEADLARELEKIILENQKLQ